MASTDTEVSWTLVVVVGARLSVVLFDIDTATPVGGGTTSVTLGLLYVDTWDFQPLSTSLNLLSAYSKALIVNSGLLLSSVILVTWYFFALPVSSKSPVVDEEITKAHITSELGVSVKALSTVKLLTEPALVLTVCFSTLEYSEKYACIEALLVLRKFDVPSCVFTKVSKSPFFTPVVLEAKPLTLKVALVPEVVKPPKLVTVMSSLSVYP